MVTHVRRFNVLIVSGGGSKIRRLNLPYGLLRVGLIVLGVAVSILGLLLGDYIQLKRQSMEVAALHRDVVENRRRAEIVEQRLAEIRAEVDTWESLHASIRKPLGPEQGATGERGGVGGSTVPIRQRRHGTLALTEELDQLLVNVKEERHKLQSLGRFMTRAGPALAALPSRWPVRGAVNSEFGRRLSPWSGAPEFHSGIDIAAGRGTAVNAPAPGRVVFAGTSGDYGRTVILDHGDEIKTVFGHLEKIQVTAGQAVQRGQQIALSGNTGRSTGSHLHYEVSVKGRALNPRSYLWD